MLVESAGLKLEPTVEEGLNGPTAVVFANSDEIAPLQLIGKTIKEMEKPELKFGLFDSKFLDAQSLTVLSKLPGKQVLYGQLVSSLSGPAYGLVGVLNANLQQLVYILEQRRQQMPS
jgi:large subunit ribosomal protein L10